MANILDYLDWRGDLTLAERGFNEVDNLLMAELCFLDFSGIVPADFSAPVFLPDAMRQYDAARPQETMGVLVPEQIPELGHKMAASRRFSDLTLCAYVSRTDEETQTQFSALTILLPDKTAYIAFRGTDDTIVGWKEDFNLAFLPVVPAQKMAAEYLSAAAAALPSHPLRVGGHSKGGNLAVYSAVFCGEAVQNQLMRVYNNDGPGFRTSLPPTLNGLISMPFIMHSPPVPCGPIRPLCPVKHSTSMPMACISIGMQPADCDASTIIIAPFWCASFAMRAMSSMFPVRFEAWVHTTARVLGVISEAS